MADLTRRNVIRQLGAMGVEIVVLVPEQDGDDAGMMLREWNREMLLKSLSWLKGQNASGHHIFIRPHGSQGLLFMDDFNVSNVRMLERAAVVESSHLNFQAWVRIGSEPFELDLVSAIGKILLRRYGGDLNSSDWRHFGLLVGFTNRKPQYMDDRGQCPFVKLWESTTMTDELVGSEAIHQVIAETKLLLEDEKAAQLAEVEVLASRITETVV